MDKSHPRIGIITSNKAGWKSVRMRWIKALSNRPEFDTIFYCLEDYAQKIDYLTTEIKHFKTLWYLLAGRTAANKAIRDGCSTIVINTFHHIPLLPINKNIRYISYGDASANQLTSMSHTKNKKIPSIIDSIYKYGIRRHANAGMLFLGMSDWYLKSLKDDYLVDEMQLKLLHTGVDIKIWHPIPSHHKSRKPNEKLRIIMCGAPFKRKGGLLINEISKLKEFENCYWDIISFDAEFDNTRNCTYHNNLEPNNSKLVELYQNADIMLLPTYADCSSIAGIEAQACGLPLIMTDIGGTNEILSDKITGHLIPNPPTIEKIIKSLRIYTSNKEILLRDSIAARKRAENLFSLDSHVQTLISHITNSY